MRPASKRLLGVTILPRLSDHPSLWTGSQMLSLPACLCQQEKLHWKQLLSESMVILCTRLHARTQTGYTHADAYCTQTPTDPHMRTSTQQHGASNLISGNMAHCTCSALQGLAGKYSASHTVRSHCVAFSDGCLALNTDYRPQTVI